MLSLGSLAAATQALYKFLLITVQVGLLLTHGLLKALGQFNVLPFLSIKVLADKLNWNNPQTAYSPPVHRVRLL